MTNLGILRSVLRAMVLEGVRLEVPSNVPVMVLREVESPGRVLTIYIGSPEAAAIHHAVSGVIPPRPLTHDLFVEMMRALQAELQEVVVTEVREHTYFAEMHVLVSGDVVTVSCRPSDAVALAVRTGSPILATKSLLDEVGRDATSAEGESGEETIIDNFRDFIDRVNPDDFGG